MDTQIPRCSSPLYKIVWYSQANVSRVLHQRIQPITDGILPLWRADSIYTCPWTFFTLERQILFLEELSLGKPMLVPISFVSFCGLVLILVIISSFSINCLIT